MSACEGSRERDVLGLSQWRLWRRVTLDFRSLGVGVALYTVYDAVFSCVNISCVQPFVDYPVCLCERGCVPLLDWFDFDSNCSVLVQPPSPLSVCRYVKVRSDGDASGRVEGMKRCVIFQTISSC